MKRVGLMSGWIFCLSWMASTAPQAVAQRLQGVDPLDQHLQQLGDIQFRLPHGMSIERVAEPPLIRWPVVADWDQMGRLVVIESTPSALNCSIFK